MFSPKEKTIRTFTELFRTCKSDPVIFTTPAPLIYIYTGKPMGGVITATKRRGRWRVNHPIPLQVIYFVVVNLTLKKYRRCWRQAPQRWSGPRWLLAEGRFLSGIRSGGHWGPHSLRFLLGHHDQTSASCTLWTTRNERNLYLRAQPQMMK